MVRLDDTHNTPFVSYLGPYTLDNKKRDWEGDGQKRQPSSGKQILSPRARLMHRNMEAKGRFEPEAEPVLTVPGHIKRNVDDRGLAAPPRGHSRQWPG